MAFRVWLPLNGTLENKGISEITLSSGTPTYTNGKIGQCLSSGTLIFNLPTNFINNLSTSRKYSICCWCKNLDASASTRWIFLIGSGTGGCRGLWESNATNFRHWAYGGSGANISTTINTIDGQWHHIVFTSNSDNIVKLYVDGIYQSEITSNPSTVLSGANTIQLNATNYNLNDFRIYDHCLSPKEVKEISQALVLHYKLDGFSGGSGENLALNSKTFNSWSIGSGWVKGEEDGYTTYNFSRTGATANNWVRIIPTLKINPNDYPNGITVSMDIKPVDISVINQTCLMSLQIYKADGTRVGWNEPQRGTGGMINNQWTRISYTFNQNALKTISTSGYTTADISYTQFSFQLVQNGNITIRKIKIEDGAIATPYSEAREDLGITKIKDNSGYEHDGTIIGTVKPENNSTRYNNSLYFNGSSSIEIQSPFPVGTLISNFTHTAWIKWNNASASGIHSISWGNEFFRFSLGKGNKMWSYGLRCATDGTTSAAGIGQFGSSSDLVNGQWYFVAITFNKGICKSYLNGELVGTVDNSATYPYLKVNRSNLFIGTYGGSSEYAIGNVADSRFYTTTLSVEDILDLYHTPINVDNLQNIHTFEFQDNDSKTAAYKNGILSTSEIHEANGELLNSFSSGGYAPVKNTNNSCVDMGIVNFTNYASLNKDLPVHIECDVKWTAFTPDTGGTWRGLWWQGSNYKKETSAYAWEGTNYICNTLNSKMSLQNTTTVATAGQYHYDVTVTIPASWFNTYSKSYVGFRCDYSDGTGRIDVTNFKVTPLQYYDARIGKDFISANNFIEK